MKEVSTRAGRRLVAGLAAAALTAAGLGIASAGPASAAETTIDDATFTWGLNGEQGAGAYFGGCNFLSAGTAGDTGSSRVWSQADGFYSTQSGNVTVEKPDAADNWAQPTWSTKCQDPNGTAVSAGSVTSLTKNRIVFSSGTGTVDPEANTATISWSGSFTSVFYGGLTYWSATDPTLTVEADGTATVTATASGYGASMEDPTKWEALPSETITLANLTGVTVTETGFTVTPDYLGVAVTSSTTAQPAKDSTNEAYWGAFPQDFVDFQIATGQSSYWYTSGGSRDRAKPTTALAVSYTTGSEEEQVAPTITTQPTDASAEVGGTATFTAAASGVPAPTVQWQLKAPGSPSWQDYPGATDTTFSLPIYAAGYDGSQVRAVFTNEVDSVTTDEVNLTVTEAGTDPEPVVITPAVPTITGTAAVGQTLTAIPGTWTPADVTLSYQWSADGQPIAGATTATLALTAAQAGKKITVAVTGTASGLSETKASAETTPVANGSVTVETPTLTGKAKAGKKLTAAVTLPAGVDPAQTAVTYQWFKGKKAIKGATGASLKLTKKLAGKKVSVQVTVTATGYEPVTVKSAVKKIKKK